MFFKGDESLFCQLLIPTSREQLSRCREHLSSLVDQCTSLEEEISREEQDKNTAAVALLRSQLAKVWEICLCVYKWVEVGCKVHLLM